MTRLRGALTNVCIVVTMALVIGVGLEGTARLLSAAWQASPPLLEHSAKNALLLKQPWGAQHLADTGAGPLDQYVPYVEFREREYTSATLNVDRQGRRRVPGSCERDDKVTVMAFGGSTMFGAGVPDEHSIPAYLAAGLNRDGRCVSVVNYGSSWWQSSQSMIQLIEALKHGARPAIVIFYDGINEVNAVTFGGVAGGIAPDVAAVFAQVFDPDDVRGWGRVARHSLLVRTLTAWLLPSRHKTADNDYVPAEADRPASIRALVDIYAANVGMVTVLAKEFGFTAHFFLQPVPMIAGKHLTPLEEAAFQERARVRGWEREWFREAYRGFVAHPGLQGLPNFSDISGIFDGIREELYLDSEHLLPEGNRLVAERIIQELTLP